VRSLRCSACRASSLEVPDLYALDVLIGTLAKERPLRTHNWRPGTVGGASPHGLADDLPSGQPT
jgi:hypothetical protein